MPSLRLRLPPLNGLVAFEAAARHSSFTRAGEEMGISREAVSRQIRILEGHLGVRLFLRRHRALDLTPAGTELQAVARQSLGDIARCAGALRRAGRPAKVTVTATIAIATYWLTPRLPRFRKANPGIEIRVADSDAPADLAGAGIDVGLRYGDGTWPGLEATRLFDVESFPVCAPGYLTSGPKIASPADLVHHTLLNLDGPPHAAEDWAWWLAGAGVTPPASIQMLGFDSYANVIQAALDGQGIALGFSGILDGLLSEGTLVRPLALALSRGLGVYLVVPRGVPPDRNARKLFDWILAEAGCRAR